MKIRKEARPRTLAQPLTPFLIFYFLFFTVFFVAGCGAPGEPLPPSPPIPVAVDDLMARQAGDAVLLTFTMPGKSTLGERLTTLSALEILRGSLKPDGTLDARSFRVVDTVPGALVAGYIKQGKLQFLDPIPLEEMQAHPGETVVYRVRMRVTDKKVSPNSNDVLLDLFPVSEKIESLEALVTENGIQLKWQPPGKTSSGGPLGAIQEYHVYRGEVDPQSAEAGSKDLHETSWKSPLLQIAVTGSPDYLDSTFDYGKTYIYLVRTVTLAAGAPLESSDSHIALVTPKDTFPPAAPQGIVAAILPGDSPGSLVVDLSWSINIEPDLAGYRVYRSDQEGLRGDLLTPDLLPTPAYRDTSVAAGKHHWYTVTAVDRAGNESAPSAPLAVEVAQRST
jgi:hypothetical protein